jgi:hypothetical protein
VKALLATCFHAGTLLSLFFNPENRDDFAPVLYKQKTVSILCNHPPKA